MGPHVTATQWAGALVIWGIWFAIAAYLILRPEVVGQATGLLLVRYVNRRSPAWTMRFVGCAMVAYLPAAVVARATHRWWVGLPVGLGLAVALYWVVARRRPTHENEIDW